MYLTKRFYIVLAFLVLMTGAGYVFPLLFDVGRWMFLALVILVFVELFLLYHERGMMASRTLSERFSNGDDNEVNKIGRAHV